MPASRRNSVLASLAQRLQPAVSRSTSRHTRALRAMRLIVWIGAALYALSFFLVCDERCSSAPGTEPDNARLGSAPFTRRFVLSEFWSMASRLGSTSPPPIALMALLISGLINPLSLATFLASFAISAPLTGYGSHSSSCCSLAESCSYAPVGTQPLAIWTRRRRRLLGGAIADPLDRALDLQVDALASGARWRSSSRADERSPPGLAIATRPDPLQPWSAHLWPVSRRPLCSFGSSSAHRCRRSRFRPRERSVRQPLPEFIERMSMGYQSERHRWNAILSHLGLKTIKLKKQTQPEQLQPGEMTRKDPRKKRSRRR